MVFNMFSSSLGFFGEMCGKESGEETNCQRSVIPLCIV